MTVEVDVFSWCVHALANSVLDCYTIHAAMKLLAWRCIMYESVLHSVTDARPHVSWCIWHEGCTVFMPKDPSVGALEPMYPIQRIRQEMMALQAHNVIAMSLITGLNDDSLITMIKDCCSDIPVRYGLREHFRWVCYHEGWMPEFRLWSASGLFGYIRVNYKEKQVHNPNARSLLASIRDSEIKGLVDSMFL